MSRTDAASSGSNVELSPRSMSGFRLSGSYHEDGGKVIKAGEHYIVWLQAIATHP